MLLIKLVFIFQIFVSLLAFSSSFTWLHDSDSEETVQDQDDQSDDTDEEFGWQFDSVEDTTNTSTNDSVGSHNFKSAGESEDTGEKLFLTPMIEVQGRQKNAEYVWREQARVKNISEVRSYSGFFTVDRRYNSNLFFWFFPAAYEPERAPLIVWLNGGPGTSSLFGLFVENGPFKINNQGFLENRQYAWNLRHSMLYIDSPVGTGFSFTNSKKGYSKNQADVSRNLYEALQQFFQVFPEYVQRDLYLAGSSYAGKYIPSLAMKIHAQNNDPATRLTLNLKGVMIGSGFSDPITQNQYSEYLHNMGLIDESQKELFKNRESQIRRYIRDENWKGATQAVQSLIVGHPERPSLFYNITGFKLYTNLLTATAPQEFKNYRKFITSDAVRKEIHVGDQEFISGKNSVDVIDKMEEDICQSVKPKVERLLSLNYKVLYYAAQLDIIVPHTGIHRFLNTLKWSGAKMFSSSPRRSWRVNGEIAGYTKFARNLAYVFIRNAGHVTAFDQPLWTSDMINRFIDEKPF